MNELLRLQNLITKYFEGPISKNSLPVLEQIIRIKDDENNIDNIDFDSEVIDSFALSRTEKNTLLFIQKMIIARRNGMFFELTDEQNELLNNFVLKAQSVLEREETAVDNLNITYKKILNKIKEHQLIDEIDAINNLFEAMDLPMIGRNKIMADLLSYNYKVMQEISKTPTKIELPKISEDALRQLLAQYNHDFEQINPANLKHILQNGNYYTIEEVLKELETGNYKFINDDSRLFAMILAYSNAEVLQNLRRISIEEHFNLKSLGNITSIFLPKTESDEERKSSAGRGAVLKGYENFIKTIEILKSQDISIREVIRKCDHIFRLSASRIEENITNFKLYRLNANREVGMSTFTWMGATNLMEVCDKFIELGMYSYVRKFPSRLKNIDELRFYRIYYAQKKNLPYYNYTERSGETFCLKGEVSGLGSSFGITNMGDALSKCKTVNLPTNEEIQGILKNSPNNRLNAVANHPVLCELDRYKKDSFTYNFDGKLISRIKVLRLANTLVENNVTLDEETILYLITYHSILNEEELINIKRCINILDFERRTLS